MDDGYMTPDERDEYARMERMVASMEDALIEALKKSSIPRYRVLERHYVALLRAVADARLEVSAAIARHNALASVE